MGIASRRFGWRRTFMIALPIQQCSRGGLMPINTLASTGNSEKIRISLCPRRLFGFGAGLV
jgi:hypothetical protein